MANKMLSRTVHLPRVTLKPVLNNTWSRSIQDFSRYGADVNKEDKMKLIAKITAKLAPLTTSLSCSNCQTPTMYDCRKYGHELPIDNVCPCFETLLHIPTGVFRCTVGESLGLGAAKGGCYQNPEYFSFHHMTYFDMHVALQSYRRPCPNSKRKPI